MKTNCKIKLKCVFTTTLFLAVAQFAFATTDTTGVEKPPPFKRYFAPAKVDFLFTYKEKYLGGNFFFWSKSVKAGFGTVFTGTGDVAHYGGGFIRPLSYTKYKGDMIIGVNYSMPAADVTFWDVQAEHRHQFGLCYGGGVYKITTTDTDYWGKVSYRHTVKKWLFTITGQMQKIAGKARPGGYLSVNNPTYMVAGGYAYTQYRACIGLVSPKEGTKYRPVFEALYVDNNAGGNKGVRYLFANATLGFDGGFLSHPARLGRAMGPTGLEFGNPLGFITNPRVPNNWNRKLNSWEMGRMIDFRLENYVLPNKDYNGYAQLVTLPFQFDEHKNLLDPFYAGGEFIYTSVGGTSKKQGGILAGYFYNMQQFSATAGFEYVVHEKQPIVTIAMIYKIQP